MLDYRPICEQYYPNFDSKLLTLYVNVVSTYHQNDPSASAVSGYLVRSCGFAEQRFWNWIRENNLGEFEDDYKFWTKKDEEGNYYRSKKGYCRKFRPSKVGLDIVADIAKKLHGRKSLHYVRNTRSGFKLLNEKKIEFRNKVPFSIEETNKLLEHKNPVIREWAQMLLNNFPDGYFPHCYYRNRTNRLTAIGYSFQNAPKELRNRVLKGKYSYDFESCHQSIIVQISNTMHKQSRPFIEDYVNNKKEVRRRLANQTKFSVNQIKDIIQRITFGASLAYDSNCCIYNDYGEYGVTTIINNQYLLNFYREMKASARELSNNYQTRDWYSHIPDKGKRLAYVTQSIESFFLDVVIDHFEPEVLLHDGFITNYRINPREIEAAIREEYGMVVKVEEELL